jgi:hypothetical protein
LILYQPNEEDQRSLSPEEPSNFHGSIMVR